MFSFVNENEKDISSNQGFGKILLLSKPYQLIVTETVECNNNFEHLAWTSYIVTLLDKIIGNALYYVST